MTVAILPLVLSFGTGWLLWWVADTEKPHGLGIAFVKALIVQAVGVLVLNEILSLGAALTRPNVALAWLGVALVQGWLVAHRVGYRWQRLKDAIAPLIPTLRGLTRLDRLILGGIILVLGITLATALIAPPNNWDSMTYHMPRVMHWLQNQRVAPYPTSILRQISFPPGNAALISHLQLLSGGDYWANLVQWLAFVGGLVTITRLTQHLIPPPYHPWLGAALYLSIPMAVMQATTTQNDLLTAFWISAYAFFILVPATYRRRDLFWIAASLGLAIATKPTAFIYGFPLGLVFAVKLLFGPADPDQASRPSWPQRFGQGVLVLVGALGLSIGTFIRNYRLFGTALGGDHGTRVVDPSLKAMLSNVTKTLFINLPFPPVKAFTVGFHNLIGYAIYSPNSDFAGSILEESGLKFLAPQEDVVGAPIHALLLVLGMVSLGLTWWRWRDNRRALAGLMTLSLSVLGSYGLFCLLIKWSPFHNRLMLPLFILGVPTMAFGVSRLGNLRRQRWVIVLLLSLALVYSLTTLRRPILSLPLVSEPQRIEQSPSILTLDRQAMYFSGARKEMAIPYQEAAAAIQQKQCQRVGLAFGNSDYWEYPLWVLLNSPQGQAQQPQVQLKHVGITNISATLPAPFADADLCAVIELHLVNDPSPWVAPAGWQPWYETTLQSPGESGEVHRLTVLGQP